MIYSHLPQLLAQATVVIEVGAHIGTDTVQMMALMKNPAAHYIAVEADHRNWDRLSQVGPNFQGLFEIYGAAVTSTNKLKTPFWLNHDNQAKATGLSSLKQPRPGAHPRRFSFTQSTVQTITLDALCRHLKTIDFIWADIQGGELDMLHGAVRTLPRVKAMYLEALAKNRHRYRGQPRAAAIVNFARRFGFRVEFQTPTDVYLIRS